MQIYRYYKKGKNYYDDIWNKIDTLIIALILLSVYIDINHTLY
jgi:hypothetical protein